jgi:ABC-type transport system involved in cytochrome c biogenesis ATPase subunit
VKSMDFKRIQYSRRYLGHHAVVKTQRTASAETLYILHEVLGTSRENGQELYKASITRTKWLNVH